MQECINDIEFNLVQQRINDIQNLSSTKETDSDKDDDDQEIQKGKSIPNYLQTNDENDINYKIKYNI